MKSGRTRLQRWLAGITAAALAATGAVAIDSLAPAPAHAAYPETFNPFAMNGGYTIYAREDALLQNQEVEGSIAVGGTATAQGSSGTLSLIHVAAGTGAYTLPTVDGDPTRFLVGSYGTDSTGILAITSAGTSNPALLGELKMVERDGPWVPFERAQWLRLNLEGATSPDATPLIDATAQDFPEDAEPPTGAAGNGSIYTADSSADAVAGYVEASAEASYEQADSCLDGLYDLTTGTGNPVDVEDFGDRVVLSGLSADQPNVVRYADIAGASLIQFASGPTPGANNPLVIRVDAGTTAVTGARIDPQGVFSPYILWDLSEVTGAVTVTAGSGRIDGSIYAPNADVTVDAAPLDGQIIGENVTVRGGEVHNYLFAGTISCDADSGTFRVRKQLDGIEPGDLPAGFTFTVNYTATDPDGVVTTGTLEIPATGAWVDAGTQFPLGTEIVFDEVQPASVPGYTWDSVTITPPSIVIGEGTADVVVTNSATALTGTFVVVKDVETTDGSAPPAIDPQTIPVTWTATLAGQLLDSGIMQVALDGTAAAPDGGPFPVGTVIELTEDASDIVLPPGWEWAGAGWNPGSTFVIEDSVTATITLTNTIAPAADERHVTIVKSAAGEAADPAYGYTVTYNIDPPGTRSEPVTLPVGTPIELTDIQTDADVLALAEQVPTVNGQPTPAEWWAEPVFVVTVDGVTRELPTGGFDRIVEVPLGEAGGDVAIEVRNGLRQGTFTLTKDFETVTGEHIPEGARFTAGWTATTPSGDVTTGTLRLPADGTPVGPVGDDGNPRQFPFGTEVTYDELTAPSLPWLVWGEPAISPDPLIIGTDAAASVNGTITNSATLATGTFEIVKALDGIDSGDLLIDSFTIDYTALQPNGVVRVGSFELPADGTPAGPRDAQSQPVQFPAGTIVRVDEAPLDEADLPDDFDWAGISWTPGNFLTIGAGATAELTVTNSVVQLTRFSVTKALTGPAASAVPADTVFVVDWWQLDEPQTPLEVRIGQTAYSPYIPVGTIALAEEQLPAVPGVVWGPITWTANGEPLFIAPDGRAVAQLREGEDEEISFTVTNTANAPGGGGGGGNLPATGGGAVSPLVPATALALIALGVWLVVRRTRAV
ncbi:collagen-binding domain-containing protein [Microbacterium sp. M3]|uniref:Collagen-binding domain-containing protein n=1 Tax=Microbacterium arthrosphaerae TaxID=792652 RepID=A0ABU4H457_9MICO|nr:MULTISPECIES: DUF5979 domain-containing protein [Microbacterium]MDW4574116.1 collagen-binding domain-containing protein [Microbacterium arthrosphaerae]MDW7607971.1 collagen-binding domain-containing protein [Microbacterium sp. M3]